MAKLRGNLICLLAIIGIIAQPGTSSAYSQTANPPNASLTAEAQSLLEHGRVDEALKALNRLAQMQPEPAGVERLLGMGYYEQGQIQQALQAFERALVQDPDDREAMQMEGVTLFLSGKPASAIPLLEKAHLSIPASNVDNNYVLGLCYLDSQRYDDARRAFATQYKFTPDSAAAYLLTARMMLRRDYLPLAETFAKRALTLNPALPMAHLLLGQIRLSRSELPEAVAEFEHERTLNPLFGEVYDRLGDSYLRRGDFAKAQEALDQAVLLEPNSPVPLILLGKVLLKQQDFLMAQKYLIKALAIEPGNYVPHALLGQVYRTLGQTDKASREFQLVEQIQAAAQPKAESLK